MNKGIFSKTFDTSSVDQNFSLISQHGYQATQFNFASAGLKALPDNISLDVIAQIREAISKHGIRLEAISATFNMTHPDPAVIKHGMHCLDAICAAAEMLECPLVTLCTGTMDPEDQWRFHPDNNSPEAWACLVNSMQEALSIAEKYAVALGIEPELANVVNSAAKARQLIDEMGSPLLRVIFDPANLFEEVTLTEQHKIIRDALDLLGNDIAIAHAKDRTPDGSFTTAGRGVLDYDFYLTHLRNTGFDGCVVTHGLAADEAGEVSRMLDTYLQRS
ncbi:sugar phosphate isomerase/epimerase family protein [Klebsiella grimontii]|uniref:Sugar phosphate isomerase/epimerase n=1 Tax=Klebsiella grimontii TaxID=2058152 RepID=A0A839CGG4_9ENTR|nr:sugar phosphate isomerase/epimerase family protein [Klebsiella grimontii]BAS39040.1 sugar phosphate isomerase/epimerase [Klebsiella oxytoca]MBA8009443.1 sugar phosphate isomerase/epimerase [Klebsiella grimontii]MBA8123039.1 sugar phosphate isomerase/epimerase [Klebsiella grimontii]QLP43690.1 sugar phosphate isomerase/epimerase [Klebsiella grimontii]QLU58290.1 sugar phosphate isomerase/epimerase [Klebsiella grimontii]